jgi:hypothetical protein
VRIALLFGAAFQARLQGFENGDLLGIEYPFDRLRRGGGVAPMWAKGAQGPWPNQHHPDDEQCLAGVSANGSMEDPPM